MTVWAVVVAAGSGRRFGGLKQFASLGGKPLAAWSLDVARSACDGVVLVLPADELAATEGLGGAEFRADRAVAGGATRAASVRAGLAAVPPTAEVVVVHDAVRPLATAALFERVVAAVRGGAAAAAIPGLALHDTIKRVAGDQVVTTVAREELVAVQTPQAFSADVLRLAHAGADDATDDAALVEALGLPVRVVAGEPTNLKVTLLSDLWAAEAALRQRAMSAAAPQRDARAAVSEHSEHLERAAHPARAPDAAGAARPGQLGSSGPLDPGKSPRSREPGASAATVPMATMDVDVRSEAVALAGQARTVPSIRIGQGFDVHPFDRHGSRALVLGGVTIPEETGLVGHSDADVVAHALADAVLGAAGRGDIGLHFPADQERWAGADSVELLRRSGAMVLEDGWRAVNAQCTVVCERPRLAHYVPAMAACLSAALEAPVSITAKRAEGLGAIGRVEGIACLAVALLAGEGRW